VFPMVALAQQPKVITIGVLVHSAPGWQRFWQVFPAALSERGYVEGRNVRFEFRSDEGDLSRLPELVPATHRIAALANAPDPLSKSFLKEMQLAGETTRTAIAPIMIQRPEELDVAFSAMVRERPDAIVVQPSLPTKRVGELALAHRIPAVCAFREFAYEGGLMAYSSVEADLYRHAAELVDNILAGAKPADLPVEQPTRFELIINLKTAKALGLTLPQSLLLRAGEVIE
jgi:putative tryptophan/tyrosine transport system substrate-binding protein